MKHIFLIIFLLSSLFEATSQSLDQVKEEASKMNIRSKQDILNELKKRGLTENEVRRQASLFGISYDDYVNQIIGNEQQTNQFNRGFDTTTSFLRYPMIYDSLSQEEEEEEFNFYSEDSILFFGYDVFVNNEFANKEYLIGNIDEGYILSPGDVLRIYVFGDNSYQTEAEIDLNGNILLPDIGVFMASGYTFKTLKNRLNTFLGKYFSGLIDLPKRSFIDVSLTQLRPVKINVLGESNSPGPHLVNGFATVLNAIYSSGGIKLSGSLRDISVYRNNQLIKSVDLYDFITKGSLDEDIRLMNNDIVFIPPKESSIQITGSIRKEAIYELKDNEGIKELLNFSGGLMPEASTNLVIERIIPVEKRKDSDIYNREITSVNVSKLFDDLGTSREIFHIVKKGETLYSISKRYNVQIRDIKKLNRINNNIISIGQRLKILSKSTENFLLVDGDKIKVNDISDKVLNKVVLNGSVNQPGTYPLNQYNNLRDLIIYAGENILPRTYLSKVDIYKEDISGNRSFKTYNLKNILDKIVDVKLDDQDSVYLYNLDEVKGELTITVRGFPNSIKEDLIDLDDKENLEKDLNFEKLFSKALDRFEVDNVEDLDRNEKKEFFDYIDDRLKDYDLDEDEINQEFEIGIDGLVNTESKEEEEEEEEEEVDQNTKTIFWSDGLTLYDVIFSSTSFEELKFKSKILNSRVDVKRFNVESGLFSTISFNLNNVTNNIGDPYYLIPGDEVIFYSKDVFSDINPSVQILGYVKNPGEYDLEENMTVENLILNAGGFADFADTESVILNRINFNDPLKSSDRYIININQNFLNGSDSLLNKNSTFLENFDVIQIYKLQGEYELNSVTVSGEVNRPGPITLEYKNASFSTIIDYAGGLKNTAYLPSSYIKRNGKNLFVNLATATNSLKKSNLNIIQDGDEIFISSTDGEVEVNGAVQNESSFIWEKGKKAKYYLKNSGGKLSKRGGKASVTFVSGSSKRIGFMRNPKVHPDSKIFVAFKPEKERAEGAFFERFTSIFGLLTGALTTVVLIKNIN